MPGDNKPACCCRNQNRCRLVHVAPGRVEALLTRTGVLAGGPIRGLARTMGASMARHFLGVLGVIAAGILLAVSAAMNYRFGFSLGKTAMDGQIYGLASAAADCFKALVPFFLFAAIRNRMWSQAAAAAVVWAVVTGYSMTSALGHAALNRLDTTCLLYTSPSPRDS